MPTVARLLAALFLILAAAGAVDRVDVTSSRPQAYESDPINGYGELIVRRSGTAGVLDVRLEVTLSDAIYGTDYGLGITSATGATTLLTAGPGATGPNSFDTVLERVNLRFAAGQSQITLRVLPLRRLSTDEYPVLGRPITIQVKALPDLPYLVGSNQAATVLLIDAQTRLVTEINGEPSAREGAPPINDPTLPEISAKTRFLFETLQVGPLPDAVPLPYTPFSTKDVILEVGGTATLNSDYQMEYTLGAGNLGYSGSTQGYKFASVNSDNGAVFAARHYAYRLTDEYGFPESTTVSSITVSNGSVQPSQTAIGSGQVLITALPGATFLSSATVSGAVPSPNGGPPSTLSKTGVLVSAWAADEDGTFRLALAQDIRPNPGIRHGALVTLEWTEIENVTYTPAGSATPVTVQMQVWRQSGPEAWRVDVPTMYDEGTTALTVRLGNFVDRASYYAVGDVIEIQGELYRVTGPTPSARGGTVLRTFSLGGSSIPNRAGGDSVKSYISISPGLQKKLKHPPEDLIRDDPDRVGVPFRSIWPLTVDADKKTRVRFPAFPRGPSPVFPAATAASSWPIREQMDVRIRVMDDLVPERAESVILTAQNGASTLNGYDLKTPQQATMWIGDNDAVANIVLDRQAVRPQAASGTGGVNGRFLVTLSKAFDAPLTVPVDFGVNSQGTSATYGTDFTVSGMDAGTLRGTVTFAPGTTAAYIEVVPQYNPSPATPPLNVSVQLYDSLDYVLQGSQDGGINVTASVLQITQHSEISNAIPEVIVEAVGNATEGGATGLFRIRLGYARLDPTVVNIRTSGRAQSGVDYLALPASITIPAGALAVDVIVTALTDALAEGSESLTLTVDPGLGYRLGTRTSATIDILDAGGGGSDSGGVKVEQKKSSKTCGLGSGSGLGWMLGGGVLGLALLRCRDRRS